MTNKTYKIAIALDGYESDYSDGLEFSWETFDTEEEAREYLVEWLRDIGHNDGGNFGEADGERVGSVWEAGEYEDTLVTNISESEALSGTGMHLYAACSTSFIEAVAYCKARSYEEAAEKIASNWEEADDFFEYIVNEYGEIAQFNDGEVVDCFHVEEI